MNSKISILLLTCAFVTAQVFASECADLLDAETRGSKKCGKFKNLAVCNNALVGGNETINGALTVVGAAATGALTVNGNETVNGSLLVTGTILAGAVATTGLLVQGSEKVTGNLLLTGTMVAGGNVIFDNNTLPLNALGSAETVGARMVWGQVPSDAGTTSVSVGSGIMASGSNPYTITFNTPFTTTPTVLSTVVSTTGFTSLTSVTTFTAVIETYNQSGTQTAEAFNIIAIGY